MNSKYADPNFEHDHVLMDGHALIRMMQLTTERSNPSMWHAYMGKKVRYHVPKESFQAALKEMNLDPYKETRIMNLIEEFPSVAMVDLFDAETVLIPTLDNLEVVKREEIVYFPLVAWRLHIKYPSLTMNLASDALWDACIRYFKHEKMLG